MAKRRSSRRRSSRRPAARRRRTSKRRSTRRRTTKNRSLKTYLYYRTPGGQKKLRSLGASKAARAALKNWRARVRGKGYRTLKIVNASSVAEARSKLAIKPRRRSSRKRA